MEEFCRFQFSFLFSGNAITTIKSNDPVKLMTVRGTAFAAAPADGGNSSPENSLYFTVAQLIILTLF